VGPFPYERVTEASGVAEVEHVRRANEELLFVPLIEDQAALQNLPAICSTPGVDVVIIGPSDLALSMGIPGGWQDPRVQTAVEQIRAAAEAAGKPVMILALDAADGRALYERGYQMLAVSISALMTNAARTFLKEVGRS
jgi:4-hydroxy-2-oxoheptanedioate aldolase